MQNTEKEQSEVEQRDFSAVKVRRRKRLKEKNMEKMERDGEEEGGHSSGVDD